MKVFIGMETSGMMRRAFAAAGHEVISCDLLPAQDDQVLQFLDVDFWRPRQECHIVGDVFHVLNRLSPSAERWQDRADTYPGIAAAIVNHFAK